MTIKESVEQLENLIEAWQLDEADLNQTDIDAIKHTLKENKTLKQQLDYLRSGEYYNQLRFENEMLQNVVDTNGIPSEVYDYIECTHRNTELLEENEQLKKELEQSNAVADTNKELAESFHKENERLKSLLKCDYEDNQEIMADIIKEKQELIDYLKLSIEFEKSNSLWTSKKRLKVYEEILSKIESGKK